jgi:hypothetical protein
VGWQGDSEVARGVASRRVARGGRRTGGARALRECAVERIRMSAGAACGTGGLVRRGVGEQSSHFIVVRLRVRPDGKDARRISLSFLLSFNP